MADTSTTERKGWAENLDRLTKDCEGQDVTIAGAFRAVQQDGATTIVTFFPASGG